MKNRKMMTSRGAAFFLGALCSLAYFTSYFTRYSLTVCIAEITDKGLLTKEQIGLATMMLFICYGAGQIVSGILGDKFPPQYIVLAGLTGGALSNALLPFIIRFPVAVAVLWGINGFFQSMFWPPLVKIIACSIPGKFYTGATLAVSIAAHVANISLYLLASLMISVADWTWLFWVSSTFAAVMIAAWVLCFNYFRKHYKNEDDETPAVPAGAEAAPQNDKHGLKVAVLTSGALILLVGIIFQGMIKEGVTAWLPSFIVESYQGGSTSDAILKSVAIPIASIICLFGVDFLYRKFLKNEALGAAVMFGVGTLMAFLMFVIPDMPPMVKIILAALLTGTMHGVNLFLIAYLPGRFKRFGNTSTVSGVTNACAYVGCAAYSYGIAAITERFGWTATVLSWLLIPAIGFIACVIAIPMWSRFLGNGKKKRNAEKEKETILK